ncbi:MAG: glutamate ABC transporter substrate-binding protein [Actinomycetota bacterium]
MRNVQRWRWLVALVAVVALVGAACGGEEETPTGPGGGDEETQEFEAGTTMAELQEKGEVVIGVKFDVPPFGFKNPQTNEVEGFDVDLGKLIAEKLGVEPKFIEAISDNRIPYLTSGKADLILSTMTITTDRDAEIDFSRPYYIAHGRILVPEDSDIASVADLAGRKVCTARGSTYEALIPEEAPEADLKLVDAYGDCLALVQNGAVDAVSTDDVILTGMVIQSGEEFPLKLVGEELTTDPYGAGIPDGDTEFKEFVDGVLDESFEDGTWDGLYENWVGQHTGVEAEDPSQMTLEDALEIYPCDETC